MDGAISLVLLRQLIRAENGQGLQEHLCQAQDRARQAHQILSQAKSWFDPESTADPGAFPALEKAVQAAKDADYEVVVLMGKIAGFHEGLACVDQMISEALNEVSRPR